MRLLVQAECHSLRGIPIEVPGEFLFHGESEPLVQLPRRSVVPSNVQLDRSDEFAQDADCQCPRNALSAMAWMHEKPGDITALVSCKAQHFAIFFHHDDVGFLEQAERFGVVCDGDDGPEVDRPPHLVGLREVVDLPDRFPIPIVIRSNGHLRSGMNLPRQSSSVVRLLLGKGAVRNHHTQAIA